MINCVCPMCRAKLKIDENDVTPERRKFEVVRCPVCHKEFARVFTSGIPTVTALEE